jgi:hypothetical protein
MVKGAGRSAVVVPEMFDATAAFGPAAQKAFAKAAREYLEFVAR